jgi:hypothetical protein
MDLPKLEDYLTMAGFKQTKMALCSHDKNVSIVWKNSEDGAVIQLIVTPNNMVGYINGGSLLKPSENEEEGL